jgi:hypothetical protein
VPSCLSVWPLTGGGFLMVVSRQEETCGCGCLGLPMRLMPLPPHSKRLDEHHSHLALPVEGHNE